MKLFFIFALILMTSCATENDQVEDTSEIAPVPFPRNYKSFYAGMSVDELFVNAKEENFYLTGECSKWTRLYDGEIIGPKLILESGSVILTAYPIDGRIARLEFDGDNDPFFHGDLTDIYENFGGYKKNGSKRTFSQDSLKTHIDKSRDVLELTHNSLWGKWMDSETEFMENLKTKIQEKYS
ncbi:MAG: hypothetical protein GQ574_07240 [Crocinitomix sp.]|nr:hypothetical protein [Crocinitomix sp.]